VAHQEIKGANSDVENKRNDEACSQKEKAVRWRWEEIPSYTRE